MLVLICNLVGSLLGYEEFVRKSGLDITVPSLHAAGGGGGGGGGICLERQHSEEVCSLRS